MSAHGARVARAATLLALCAPALTACGGTTARQAAAPSPYAPAREPASSGARDYYVSRTGDDRHDGSRGRPWRTLRHAASHAGPGSMVHVAPGHYGGPLDFRRSGRPGSRIRFVSERRWAARISAHSTGSLGIVQVAGDYVDLDGFDVSGSGGDGTVGIVVPGSHVRVMRNRVHDVTVACNGDNGGGGIVAGGGLGGYGNHDIEVRANLVHDVVGAPTRQCPGVQGIYASVARVLIANNVVYRNAHDCITSWHAASRLTVVNNTAIDCPGAGITIGSGGSGATDRGNVGSVVSNNLVYGNGQGVVETSDGAHRVAPDNRYLNNLVFHSGSGDLRRGDPPSRGAVVSGTVSSNPRIMGLDGVYRLKAKSPAIDAGTTTGAPRTDFDGVRRPQGRGIDIGAFEWRQPDGGS